MDKETSSSGGRRRQLAALRVLIVPAPLLLFFLPLDFVEKAPSFCLWLWFTEDQCLGCGMGRALLNLLHLNFTQAWQLNHLVVFVAPLLVFIWARSWLRTQ